MGKEEQPLPLGPKYLSYYFALFLASFTLLID
jgi:hypothetical protein